MQNLVENLVWSLAYPQPGTRRLNQVTMGLLLLQLLHCTQDLAQGPVQDGGGPVLAALREVEENYRDADLSRLARQEHVALSTLSTAVRQATGKTFKELLLEKRPEQGRRAAAGDPPAGGGHHRRGGVREYQLLLPPFPGALRRLATGLPETGHEIRTCFSKSPSFPFARFCGMLRAVKGGSAMKYHLAVDIGASSGRHILGHVEQGRIVLEEVYRFENGPKKRGGRLCWDFDALAREVVNGLKACAKLGKVPATLGVDTWGVDFALVDQEGRVLGDTVAYRDSRTQGMDALVEERIPAQELYRRTGIQKQSFNTQSSAAWVKRQSPELLEQAHRLLLVPDYLHYTLTGVMSNEYTEASTSGLVSAAAKDWDRELLRLLGFPQKLFGTLSLPGTALGGLRPALREELGFGCQVVLPASHDTGSAFLAVPAGEGDSVTLSSGTWSLLGVELETPVTTPESRAANFTNEGGYQYRFRYLKNIMGLWMIQNLRREMAENERLPGFGELSQLAREAADFPGRVDVDDPQLYGPGEHVRRGTGLL